ncbi:hypothetical protein B4099_3549 [Heyndrickxia coagulans]|uniref:Uncharacterized protein n=1 Tax=Heyndrickxia coagulans TaxID=1398 RepID=A0A150JRY5_HEYCO|nr:hypothetical protein B4099_3549 [Heyndrickxia coagulans]
MQPGFVFCAVQKGYCECIIPAFFMVFNRHVFNHLLKSKSLAV